MNACALPGWVGRVLPRGACTEFASPNTMQFSTEEIYEIMALQKAGGGPFGFEDAACEFLKSDSSVNWQSWLSITDFCSSNGPNYEWQEDLKKCTALVDRASCIPGQ